MMAGVRALSPAELGRSGETPEPPFGTFAPGALQAALIALARRTPLHRGAFRPAMARAVMGTKDRPLDIAANGCAWRIHGTNNLIECGLLLHPAYNGEDIAFLAEGAQAGDTFIDIGANIGLYALPLAKAVGASGIVLAIDPNPLMTRRLAFNAAASGLADTIRLFDCAVSDRETRGVLTIRNDDVAIVALEEKGDGDIRVRTLASIAAECSIAAIHGLKIDVEGHEDKALAPFLETAPDALLPSRIVIETAAGGSDYPACAAAFARRGYKRVGRTRNNSLYAIGTRM